jgi:hypothetical protein
VTFLPFLYDKGTNHPTSPESTVGISNPNTKATDAPTQKTKVFTIQEISLLLGAFSNPFYGLAKWDIRLLESGIDVAAPATLEDESFNGDRWSKADSLDPPSDTEGVHKDKRDPPSDTEGVLKSKRQRQKK